MSLQVVHVVVTDAFAGVERYLTYVCPALGGAGVEVSVVGGSPAAMSQALAGSGVEHLPGATVLQAARSLRRVSADLVHVHMTAAETAAVAARGRQRWPIVATRHFAAPRGTSPAGRLVSPLLARRISREVAISNFVARSIGGSPVVIPNAVPEAVAGDHREPFVLVAQRLEREKSTDVALRAWAQSTLPGSGWRLVVAGRGALVEVLRALAQELGIARTVDFVGFAGDVDDLMRRCTALLAPAPAEPFGLTVVEAMARATPIVAAAGGAHLETAGGVSRDWLFEPGDDAGCALLLDRLAASGGGLAEYGRKLRDRQQREYSLGRHVERLVELYSTLAS